MGEHISKSQFKSRALEYFRQVENSGESLVITDHGKPSLELRPYKAPGASPLEILRDSVLRYDNPTDPVSEDDWDTLK